MSIDVQEALTSSMVRLNDSATLLEATGYI